MKKEWKVFILGNKNRGDEVIKVLTDLGGKTEDLHGTNEDSLYFINHDRIIDRVYLSSEMAKIIMDNYSEIKLPEKWKDGDILISKNGACYKVFSEYDAGFITNFFAYNMSISVTNGTIAYYSYGVWACEIKDYRLATPSEVDQFHILLHKNKKDWDAEKKVLTDWKWKPKMNEEYWIVTTTLDVNFFIWREGPTDIQMFDCGNCFRTKEEAEVMSRKIKKLMKREQL